MSLIIPELGLFRRIGPFTIDGKEQMTKTLFVSLPEYVEPGYYSVRIVVGNDDVKRVKIRDIIVV